MPVTPAVRVAAVFAAAVLAFLPTASGADSARGGLRPMLLPEPGDVPAEAALRAAFPSLAAGDLGGLDVRLVAGAEIYAGSSVAITRNGDVYVSVTHVGGVATSAQGWIYRSTDAGETFAPWLLLSDLDATTDHLLSSIRIEGLGPGERLFAPYQFRSTVPVGTENRVYSCTPGPVPTDVVDAAVPPPPGLASGGILFIVGNGASDPDVRRLVGFGQGAPAGSPAEVGWLTRSEDRGATWSTPVPLFDPGPDKRLFGGFIAAGDDDVVHAVATVMDTSAVTPLRSARVQYRRIPDFGAGGPGSFGPIVDFAEPGGPGLFFPSVAAAPDTDVVVVSYMRGGTAILRAAVRASFDGGLSWTAPAETLATTRPLALAARGPGAGFIGWTEPLGFTLRASIGEAGTFTPTTWPAFQTLADHNNADAVIFNPCMSIVPNPARSGRAGVVWEYVNLSSPVDTARFDGAWRGAIGPPVLAPGFPVALASAPVASPAVCELDGDFESEIVFMTADAQVHAVNHDGTPLPGWPVTVGAQHSNPRVAVGDLDGDNVNEVVCGGLDTWVFALRADGTAVPGFPRQLQLGGGNPAHVSLVPRPDGAGCFIAAGANTSVYLLDAAAATLPGWPRTVGQVSAPPSSGDLDDDGVRDIVVVAQQRVVAYRQDGATIDSVGIPPPVVTNAPVLADLDGDARLDVLIAASDGSIFAFDQDLTIRAGWPVAVAPGFSLEELAVAEVEDDSPGLEVVINVPGARGLHLLSAAGTPVGTWPRSTGASGFTLAPPTIDLLDEGEPDVIVPGAPGDVRAFYGIRNAEIEVPGFPAAFPVPASVATASGDIDRDGRVELVVLGTDRLEVFDLEYPVIRTDPARIWPMEAYDPRRTGCLACVDNQVVGVPGTPIVAGTSPSPAIALAPPRPNPSPGAVRFELRLARAATVRFEIVDARGRRLWASPAADRAAGSHVVAWDGRDEGGAIVPAGVYFARAAIEGTGSAGERAGVRFVRVR